MSQQFEIMYQEDKLVLRTILQLTRDILADKEQQDNTTGIILQPKFIYKFSLIERQGIIDINGIFFIR